MNTQEALTLESMNQAVWYNLWTSKKFSRYLKGRILEVGCGIGNFTKTLTEYGEVFAIDINKDYLNETKKNTGDSARVGFGDIEIGKYNFGDQKFDCIVCLNVLEHIKKDKEALKNLYLLLKKNGYLTLLVPIHNFLYGEIDKSIGHLRRYNPVKLKFELKDLGFTIIKSRKLNFLGAIGWFIAGRILKDKQVSENKIKLFNLISPLVLFLENIMEPLIGTSVLIVAKKE